MGLAEQALGRRIDGEAHLTKALEAAQDSWIAKYREALEGSRAEIAKHLGSLPVTGGPDGAEFASTGACGHPAPASNAPSPHRHLRVGRERGGSHDRDAHRERRGGCGEARGPLGLAAVGDANLRDSRAGAVSAA